MFSQQIEARRSDRRQVGVYLTTAKIDPPAKVAMLFEQAAGIKNDATRTVVLQVLQGGLDNADDTNVDGYAQRAAEMNRTQFWELMFFGSCQGLNEYSMDNKRARRWLQARGLV